MVPNNLAGALPVTRRNAWSFTVWVVISSRTLENHCVLLVVRLTAVLSFRLPECGYTAQRLTRIDFRVTMRRWNMPWELSVPRIQCLYSPLKPLKHLHELRGASDLRPARGGRWEDALDSSLDTAGAWLLLVALDFSLTAHQAGAPLSPGITGMRWGRVGARGLCRRGYLAGRGLVRHIACNIPMGYDAAP